MKHRQWLGAGALVSLMLGAGCNLLLGLPDFEDGKASGSPGTGGAGGAGSSSTGTIEVGPCMPMATKSCYEGKMGTENVGVCASGIRTCNAAGTAFEECKGQVLPGVEDCSKPGDEDCDGTGCSDLIFAKSFVYAGTNLDDKVLMAVDPQGNVYLTGGFSATLDFGGGPLVPVGMDVFLTKLDKDGKYLWNKRFGGSGDQKADAITVDAQGNITIAGIFSGTVDFGQGPLTAPAGYYSSVFVASFDGDGKTVSSNGWSAGGYIHIFDVVVDSGDNVILSGACEKSINFGGVTVTSSGGIDAFAADSFLVKLKPNLAGAVWGTIYADPDNEWANIFLAVDSSDSILMAGDFRGKMKIGSTPLSSTSRVPYLAKLAADGTTVWASQFVSTSSQYNQISDVDVDKLGNIFITGYTGGNLYIGDATLEGPGGYIAKFDGGGVYSFYGKIYKNGGVGEVAMDTAGNILMNGYMSVPIDFGGGPIGGPGSRYVVKRKPNGDYLWGKAFGYLGASPEIVSLGVEPVNNTVYIAGRLSGKPVDFGQGPVNEGIFVARFNP
jgi:hypothetical protein